MAARPPDGSTPLDVRFLTGDTPFAVLDLPLSADTLAVRRKLDELQMVARLQHTSRDDDAAPRYREAGNALLEPVRRLSAEFFSLWADSPAYPDASIATRHDAVLAALRRLFAAPPHEAASSAYAEACTAAIEQWGTLCDDPALVALVAARAAALGARIDDAWAARTTGWALAALVQRLPSAQAGGLDIAAALAALEGPATAVGRIERAAATAPALTLLGVVREAFTGPGAPGPQALVAPLSVAFAIIRALDEATPTECAALRSTLARTIIDAARTAYTPDEPGLAEALLVALVAERLDDADRAEAGHELSVLREARAARERGETVPPRIERARSVVPQSARRAPLDPTAARRRMRTIAIGVGSATLLLAVVVAVVAMGRARSLGATAGAATGTATSASGDPERDGIEKARAALQQQAADLETLRNAVDALAKQIQAEKPAPGADTSKYDGDLARYNDLLKKRRTASDAYDAAEAAFNKQVAAYNDRFRR